MKKLSFLILVAGLAGCFGKPPVVNTGLEGKPIPSFKLLLMDSTTQINTNDIGSGKPVVLLLISHHCTYCRALTDDIIQNVKSLTDIRFYMLSSFPFHEIKQYCDQYKLKDYSNIVVGQ